MWNYELKEDNYLLRDDLRDFEYFVEVESRHFLMILST
jgi:hypothetical protein